MTCHQLSLLLLCASLAAQWPTKAAGSILQDTSESSFSSNLIPADESFSHFSQLQGELPFDKELSVFLFKAETKRFYFQTFSPQANFSLTVTPCESALRWELFFIPSKSLRKLRKRKVRRSKKYYIRFLNRKLANDDANRVMLLNHSGSQRFTYAESATKTGLYVVQLSSADSTDLSVKLQLQSSSRQQPYPKIPPVAAVLSKQIYPPKKPLLETNKNDNNDDNNGENEEDNEVLERKVEKKMKSKANATASVELWWNPAIASDSQPAFLLEYCLVISERRHYRDNCLHFNPNSESNAEPELADDLADPALQLDGISVGPRYTVKSVDNQINEETEYWQAAARRLLLESLRKDFADFVVHYRCYNSTRATVLHQLKPKQSYFADVFVRNRMTGGASRYWTANFSLVEPPPPPPPKKTENSSSTEQQLHDSLLTGVFLEAKNRYRRRLLYRVPINNLLGSDATTTSASKSIFVYLQPCDGAGPVQLAIRQIPTDSASYLDGEDGEASRRRRHNTAAAEQQQNQGIVEEQMIFDGSHDEEEGGVEEGVLLLEEVTETRTFEVMLPQQAEGSNGSIVLEFELNTLAQRQTRNMVLLVSSELNKFPFPRLPADRAIKEFESLRSCRKLTLAWYPSPDERVLYCVLQREFNPDRPVNFKESRELCNKINPVKPSAKRALTGGPDDVLVYETDQWMTPTRKVICRRYKATKRRKSNLIMQEVRRLTPGKQYIFQVVISKGKGRSLNYEQIWAEAKDSGSCSSQG